MSDNKFDLIIIGAGPGGYETAAYAAENGLKTLLIEKDELGGTCLNRGCIPTKALLHSAHLYREVNGASYFGINADNVSVDWPKVTQRKDRLIKRLKKGIELTLNEVTILKGRAVINKDRTVQVDEQIYSADNIIVATGTSPDSIPGIDVDEKFICTTDRIMDIDSLPGSLVIIGGGVIGVEFADMYASLGVKVTIIELADDILINIDEDARNILKKELKAKKVEILTGTSIKKVSIESKTLLLSNDQQLESDLVLLSVGRKPNTDGFEQLEKNKKGYLKVDEHLETNKSGIFAVGDVNGISLYAHSATYQGLKVVDYIKSWDWKFNNNMPAVIFTEPQIAMIGETHSQYLKKDLMQLGRFQIDNDSKGFVKIFHDQDNKIIGVIIVSNKAEALIGEAVALVAEKTSIEDLKDMVHPHPSASEIFTFV